MVQRELSARRIIGFACNQAFTFSLVYMGARCAIEVDAFAFERIDLVFVLLSMVVGFGVTRALTQNARDVAFSRPLLYMYAVVMAAGSFAPLLVGNGFAQITASLVQGVLFGVPCAFLLAAWGRTFGRVPTATSVPEVFLGSLVGAFLCLLFSFVPADSPVLLATRLLPLASVVNIEVPDRQDDERQPAEVEAESDEGRTLSAKILTGTLFFGLGAGLVEASGSPDAASAIPYYPISMVLYGAFLIGGLSLLLSDGFGRGASLNKSYRLAVFVMVSGTLLATWPVLEGSYMPGESVVLAGYLGLETVLVSLFLVLAKITAQDAAVSFAAGFAALFTGELVGVVASNVIGAFAGYAVVGVAGALALASYVFLFTERDFDELSQIVTKSDDFEARCQRITDAFGLTKRESEILAFALRGRTSERIARELVISKSTVDTHLRRIYSKCGVHSRQELLDLAEKS